MHIEQGLENFLNADAALNAQVGGRIFAAGTRPQGSALPSITYKLISKIFEQTHDGPADAIEAHFEILAFGSTYVEAKATATLLRAALAPLMKCPGMMGEIVVGNVQLENEFDPSFVPEEAEELSAYHVLGEYLIAAYDGG